ncbi:MAG: four-helix bundle copper-binding protein [Actinomycetota bacterium]|nr:four-helix bundle copper-binding protein [Actinomycetota bacterium]
MHVEEMIDDSPASAAFDADLLAEAIKACFACAETCSACADACLSESDVAHMATCIRLDLLCADVCTTVGKALARQGTEPMAIMPLLSACVAICRRCADECGAHGDDHEHCALCADACRRCAEACEALVPE